MNSKYICTCENGQHCVPHLLVIFISERRKSPPKFYYAKPNPHDINRSRFLMLLAPSPNSQLDNTVALNLDKYNRESPKLNFLITYFQKAARQVGHGDIRAWDGHQLMVLDPGYGESGALDCHTRRSRSRRAHLWPCDHRPESPRNSERNSVCCQESKTVIRAHRVANPSPADHPRFFQQEMETCLLECRWSRRNRVPAGITSGHHC